MRDRNVREKGDVRKESELGSTRKTRNNWRTRECGR